MRRVYIPLDQRDIDALVRLARDQRRRPQDQAALWIAERIQEEQNGRPGPRRATTAA